ncbi:MAG TPA: hypothetical protein VMV99_03630 [Rhodanobacter sp.]|nr:hypothetical protein [Rhodanobacter sp.]
MTAALTIACRFCVAAGLLAGARHTLAAEVVAPAPQAVTLGGIIHPDSDDTLAFTPDGDTVFFDRSSGPHKTIMVSHKVNGHWSRPQVAGFSGHWFDQDPLVAPDGSYLLFDSDRPVQPGGKPLVQDYFAGGVAPGSNIWRVDRRGRGWGTPVWLGPIVNNKAFVDFASLAADGTLYFIRWDKPKKVMHIWRSPYRDGRYLPPERAGLGDPDVSTHDPAVAPDQSFIVFDYGKVKGGLGRLCIAFRGGDRWGRPIDLGDAVNKDLPWGAHLAPDGHTVYVTGQSGLWRLSLLPWLHRHAASGTTDKAADGSHRRT